MPIDIRDITQDKSVSMKDYEVAIFASGIYVGKLDKRLEHFMEDHDFSHQELGVFYTCGLPYKDYAKVMARKFEEEREKLSRCLLLPGI